MAKAHETWNVLDHGPIERLEPNLWCVTGSLSGMALKRVMTLARLEDGRVVIHSAIALEDEAMAEIEAWGRPSILLVPNAFHRLDAPAYRSRYHELEVYCPKGGRRKIEEVIEVNGTFEDLGDLPGLGWEYLEGIGKGEAVFSVASDSGVTLVINDAVFNMPHGKGVAGFIFRYLTQSTGGPRVTRIFKFFGVKDREALRSHLERLAETPDLERIIVSHHRMISDDPAGALRQAAATL
jgi:hypothetical protein